MFPRIASLVSLSLWCTLAAPLSAQRYRPGEVHWYRGNTHTHTKNSDGDATPERAAAWYREHGYQFVVITDHEYLTPVAGLNATLGAPGQFLVMQGQEVTQWGAGPAPSSSGPATRAPIRYAMHVGAIGNTRVVYPMGEIRCVGEGCGRVTDASVPFAETYRQNIAGIRAAGGLAQVNHPNGLWSVHPKDLYGIPDSTLLEIWNATTGSHNLGGSDDSGHVSISTEALWDTLLTRGQVLWGVGSDDTHDVINQEGPDAAPPGKSWVMVQADTLTPEAIMAALHQGHFYASNGITLRSISVTNDVMTIAIRPFEDERYRTQFIGNGGRVLAEVSGLAPAYHLQPNDGYVRAVVTDSNNRKAWTQPHFIRP